ncbi:hypothetical protein M422DRAFT_248267 [Sphaerobolus stellatus SS14]|uniref:Uncharacterized protein n=1 Tax=Sphaerobolus stellatus (strain SS14) TaxID=990650 RepID=A0A0C9VWG0_SPHS4|nr:hypothetical protein M422DRAFT_248267 [Sphaerobolus stellatus SS14]
MPRCKYVTQITETDPVAIEAIITHERAAELARRVSKAKKKHATRPDTVEDDYVNPTIEACHHRLQELNAAAAAESASSAGTSYSATPGENLHTITAKRHKDIPAENASNFQPDVEYPKDDTFAKDDAPALDHTLSLAGGPEPIFLPSPTRSPSPTHSPTPTIAEHTPGAPHSAVGLFDIVNDAPTTDINIGDDAATGQIPQATKCKGPHPGPLSQEQLRELRDKTAELHAWILERSTAWNISTVTITMNMGIDNRERRAQNFWNAFQSVFWDHEIRTNEALTGEVDAEEVGKRCTAEYQQFCNIPDDATEEYIDEMHTKKAKILAKYEAMQEVNKTEYEHGSTSRLMRQARKEFTLRASWYAARGVLLAGWGVSTDPRDALSHTLHFLLAGNDHAPQFFEEGKINIAELLYSFETFCAQGEMKERIRKADISADMLRETSGPRRGDDVRKENSALLRILWKNSMHEACSKVPWDNWATDTLKQHKKTMGWPDEVPWPSGPEPYVTIGRGDNARSLHASLVAEQSRRVRIIDWSDEEKMLAESLTYKERQTSSEWLNIPLVISASGMVLLRIGEIQEQADCRATGGLSAKQAKGNSRWKKGIAKDENDDKPIVKNKEKDNVVSEDSEGDNQSVTSSSVKTQQEVKRSKATSTKPKPKAREKKVKQHKKRENSDVAGVEDEQKEEGTRPRPSKRHKSRPLISDTDDEAVNPERHALASVQSRDDAVPEHDRGGAENRAGLAGGGPWTDGADATESRWEDDVGHNQPPWHGRQVNSQLHQHPTSSHPLPAARPPSADVLLLSVRSSSARLPPAHPPSRGSVTPSQLLRPPSRGAIAPPPQLLCPPSRGTGASQQFVHAPPTGTTNRHLMPRPHSRGSGAPYQLPLAQPGPPSRLLLHMNTGPPSHDGTAASAAYVAVPADRIAYPHGIRGAQAGGGYQEPTDIPTTQLDGYMDVSSHWHGSAGHTGGWQGTEQVYGFPGHAGYEAYTRPPSRQAAPASECRTDRYGTVPRHDQYGGAQYREYYHVGNSADTGGQYGASGSNMVHTHTSNPGHVHSRGTYVQDGYGVQQWDE